jgi:membrane associated rhomboid family serine protease
MTPNWALSSSITEWAELNAPWLVDVDKKLKPAAGSSVLLPMKKDPLFVQSSSPLVLGKQGLSNDNYNKNAIKADMLAMRYFGGINQQPMTRPASAPVGGMTLHEIEPSLSTPNGGGIGGEHDPELALAIRQQQAELDRITSQNSMMNGTRSGGSFVATGNGNGFPHPPGYGPTSSSLSAANGNRKKNVLKSWTTWELVALSAAYITLFLMSLSNADWTIEELSLNPWVGPSQAALVSTGAQSLALIKGWEEWWRLFTSPFLTAGLIQIIGVLVTAWSFGKYLEKALPYAAVTVPCIYLLGAVVGAMASANLDSSYVVCGAAAGVCSLLGGVWADQLLNIKKYTGQLSTFIVLTLVTAVFIATSLMPMVDVWYQSAALLTGFFVTVTILLLPKVGRGRRHNSWWVALQIICATLVIGAGTAAIVGLVLPTQLGDTVDFLQEASCLQIKYWECVPDSNSCTAEMNVNNSGNAVLTCANGMSYQVPAANLAVRTSNGGYAIGKWDLSDLCPQFCSQKEKERVGGEGSSNVNRDDGENDAFVGDDGLSDIGDSNIGGTVVPAPGPAAGLIGGSANLLSHNGNVGH